MSVGAVDSVLSEVGAVIEVIKARATIVGFSGVLSWCNCYQPFGVTSYSTIAKV